MSRTTRIRTARFLAVSLATAAVGIGVPAVGNAATTSGSTYTGKSVDYKPVGVGGGRRVR